ncbi:uncharacterized protein LAESUDRAFT_715598 [Laetiporus sulphureus 93-53]|uniref:Uncharacterized protein n=1 Tax=Laetiporus sulphureus 93-53 TaxID=1314785 RepID=A0A165D6N8_9APHY|nr:uncharacterized protein LAESUDRAFT_715598 [Laetiporus sulphureus 93-53]KZT04252.1 hypothetical protein LAESUDRAFT_715598 [Laetiporus sulphureus 93-53]
MGHQRKQLLIGEPLLLASSIAQESEDVPYQDSGLLVKQGASIEIGTSAMSQTPHGCPHHHIYQILNSIFRQRGPQLRMNKGPYHSKSILQKNRTGYAFAGESHSVGLQVIIHHHLDQYLHQVLRLDLLDQVVEDPGLHGLHACQVQGFHHGCHLLVCDYLEADLSGDQLPDLGLISETHLRLVVERPGPEPQDPHHACVGVHHGLNGHQHSLTLWWAPLVSHWKTMSEVSNELIEVLSEYPHILKVMFGSGQLTADAALPFMARMAVGLQSPVVQTEVRHHPQSHEDMIAERLLNGDLQFILNRCMASCAMPAG